MFFDCLEKLVSLHNCPFFFLICIICFSPFSFFGSLEKKWELGGFLLTPKMFSALQTCKHMYHASKFAPFCIQPMSLVEQVLVPFLSLFCLTGRNCVAVNEAEC